MPQWSTDESSPSCPGDDEWMKAVGGGLDLGASQRSWCWHQGPEHWDNTEEPSIVRRIGWSSNQGLHCTSGRWGQTVYGSERWNKPTGNSSVQVSCSVIFNSLWPHGLQHARPSCPSPTPWVHSNSCPLHQWCHPTISSSVVPFSSCLQSFPASGSFQMSQFFASGGQSIGVSVSASVLPMTIRDWFPLGWTGWISLQSKELSTVFSNTTVQKHQFFGTQLSL